MRAKRSQRPHRVLLVDDDAIQLKLIALRLRDAGFDVETACGGEEALAKVKARIPDAIVSDVLMGDLDGFGLCRQLRQDPALSHVPILLLSAHYQDQPDQRLARNVGASALVARTPEFHDELAALRQMLLDSVPEITAPDASLYEEHLRTNAHQLTKLLTRVKNAEGRYRSLFAHASDAIMLLSPDGYVVEANERWRALTGRDPQSLIGMHVRDFAAAGRGDSNTGAFKTATAQAAGRVDAVPLAGIDGRTFWMEFSTSTIDIDGCPMVLAIGRDVSEQVLAATRLATAEEKYRLLVERLPDVIWTIDMDGALTFMTQNAVHVFGFTAEEMMAEDFAAQLEHIHPQDLERFNGAIRGFLDLGVAFDIEYRRRHRTGEWVWLRNRSTATYEHDGKRFGEGMVTDITGLKRLEETLRQAQKMEAIGQLTGGIAHDFNNILAVIVANSHFLCEELSLEDPRHADAKEIAAAAGRAAALTRQLLAFSRRQVLEPRVADLGAVAAGVERMLRRVIGEDIELAVDRGADLGCVLVDVGQIEQVILNLVVNARDAMPNGGRLVLQTSNATLDAAAAHQIGATEGPYVALSVSDTGCGMTAETKRRIFEPFFTTKQVGKGTGLGLSTTYGIVQQSGGFISVYSEVGIGTVFKIYFPRVEDDAQQDRTNVRPAAGGKETILVIEDDERVRTAITRMLQPRGYRLLVASSAGDALEIAARQQRTIDLVLSDVIMPGMNGPEVVARLKERLPSLRTIFMSGYTDHAILPGVLSSGTAFVQKPFTQESLARRIRESLDAVS